MSGNPVPYRMLNLVPSKEVIGLKVRLYLNNVFVGIGQIGGNEVTFRLMLINEK